MACTTLARVLLPGTALWIMLCALSPCARAQESNSDGSLEIGIWKRLSASDQLYLPFSITRGDGSDHADGLAGIGYDRAFSPSLQARLGYRYLWELSPPEETTPFREHRGVAELFVRTRPLMRVAYLGRMRFELRDVNGDVSWRLRNRIRGGPRVALRRDRSLTPYGSLEATYDSRFRTVNKLRLSLGIAATLSPRFGIDVYGARQRDTRESTGPPSSVGITINCFL